ncbi:Interleukin-1 / 18, partial [Pristimantis euphronides]
FSFPFFPFFFLETLNFLSSRAFVLNEKNVCHIQNSNDDFLVAHPKESTASFESDGQVKGEQAIFYVTTYKEFASSNGLPAAFSCKVDNKNYFLSVENNAVIIKEGELPEEIPSESREFIFYQRNFVSDKDSYEYATFESSVKSGFFLACSEDGRNLILKPHPGEEVDKTTKFFLVFHQGSMGYEVHTFDKKAAYHIQNSYDDFLVAHPKESVAIFELDGHAKGEQAIFYVTTYKELASNGLPAAFSCTVDNKNYVLSVANNAVIIKEGELPKTIPEKTSELIFYIREFSTGMTSFRFESSLKFEPSLEQRFCLGWNKEDPKKRLILKKYNKGNINEGINFYLERN